ncbi:hypothetical protein HDK64DRAFT_321181 [Phyllosticta capitalensis]
MAYSKRQIVTALSVIYLLVLTALACWAHTSVQRYSLPLPSLISGLLIITPAVVGLAVDRLTRIRPSSRSTALTISPSSSYGTFPGAERGGGGGGMTPRALVQLLPRHYLRTQLSALGMTIFLTALASLASPYVTQNRGLTCALDNAWRDLFRAGRGGEIQLIQDAWECCGLHSVYDMAWPFARHSGGVTERSRCRQMYGRETSCYGVWEDEERRTAGLVIGVTTGVWLWKMLVLFTPRHRPSWLSTHRTPPPAPPPRATQQATPFLPRALTTAPHVSPPPPPPTDASMTSNITSFPQSQNIGTNNASHHAGNETISPNNTPTPYNQHFLAKSPSRNIPKRERNRPSALNIPYHAATPDAGYANSPGPELGDLENSSLYRDGASSDSEASSLHHDRGGDGYDSDRELFINGAPSPLPPHYRDVEDGTPTNTADPPALSHYHLRLANASSNKCSSNNSNSGTGKNDNHASKSSSQFGVAHYRRSPTAFKFPMSPLSQRSSNTPSAASEPVSAQSVPTSRPASRGDKDKDAGGSESDGALDPGAANGVGSESDDSAVSVQTAVEDRPRTAPVTLGPRRLSPRPRSKHAVLNGSTGAPKIGGFGAFAYGGGYGGVGGGGGGGVRGVKPNVPAVLVTEVGDDDDEGGCDEMSSSRERLVVRAGGGGGDE